MPYKVKFHNGYVATFDKEPTKQDIEEASQNIPKQELPAMEKVARKVGELSSQSFVPKKGIGRDIAEGAMTAIGSVVPGGRPAVQAFAEKPEARAVMGIASLGAPIAMGATPGAVVGGIAGGLAGAGVGGAIGGDKYRETGKLIGGAIGGGIGAGVGSKIVGGSNLQSQLESFVTKAIRPSMAGKTRGTQVKQKISKQADGIKEVALNKDAYAFPDAYGNIKERTPQTLGESIDAVDAVKKRIYNLYDAMGRATGEATDVDLNFVASMVEKDFSNPRYKLNLNFLGKVQEEINNLKRVGKLSIKDVQDEITARNKRLGNYFKKGVYDSDKSPDIDAAVNRAFIKIIEDKINSFTGTGYKELRRRYGSLLELDEDLAKRYMVDMRKATKGFFDLPDIINDGQIARGFVDALRGNPAGAGNLAAGIVGRIASSITRKINSPNYQIAKAFQIADKMIKNGEYSPVKIDFIDRSNFKRLPAPPEYGQQPKDQSGIRTTQGRWAEPKQLPAPPIYGQSPADISGVRVTQGQYPSKEWPQIGTDRRMELPAPQVMKQIPEKTSMAQNARGKGFVMSAAEKASKKVKKVSKPMANIAANFINKNKKITTTSAAVLFVKQFLKLDDASAKEFVRENYAKLRK